MKKTAQFADTTIRRLVEHMRLSAEGRACIEHRLANWMRVTCFGFLG
jgi:hypothetical protein